MSRASRIFSVVCVLAFMGWAIWFVSSHDNDLQKLQNIDLFTLSLVIAGHIYFVFINGLFLRVVMDKFGVIMGQWECFHISLVTSAGNSFLPMTFGMAIRGFYLKKKYDFAISKFLGTLTGNYILNFFVLFLIASISMAMIYLHTGIFNIWINLVFGGCLIALTYLIFLQRSIPHLNIKHWAKVEQVIDSWHQMKQDKKLVLRLSFLTLLNLSGSAFTLYMALSAVGVSTSVWATLYLVVMSSLSIFVKLTPGNIGISEGFLLFGGFVVNMDLGALLLAAIIMRATLYLFLLIGFPLSVSSLFGYGPGALFRHLQEQRQTAKD